MTDPLVRVVLEVEQGDGSTWRDSVEMPLSKANALTDDELAAMTKERYDAHLEHLAEAQEQQAEPVAPEAESETLDTLRTQLVDALARVDGLLAARDSAETPASEG